MYAFLPRSILCWLFIGSGVIFSVLIPRVFCDDCSMCHKIADDFIVGLNIKVNKGFVGGNTEWEGQNIGSYATSEILFNEIVETLCSSKDNSCFQLLEKLEPFMEIWWNTVHKIGQDDTTRLSDFLCIDKASICCPTSHYGSTCSPCAPCSPLGGACDGNGTRLGSGRCTCKPGYTGITCADCDLRTHFRSEHSDDSPQCRRCHISCAGTCRGPSASDCFSCAPGWTQISSDGNRTTCLDINECEQNPCGVNRYCENTDGSYHCYQCSSVCRGCTGPSSNQCLECNVGYHLVDQECVDVNECESDSSLCSGDGEVCKNSPGSFTCACARGYERRNGVCSIVDGSASDSFGGTDLGDNDEL